MLDMEKGRILQPTPQRRGDIVVDDLLHYLEHEALQLVRARHEFGMQKYGQPLMTGDVIQMVDALRKLMTTSKRD